MKKLVRLLVFLPIFTNVLGMREDPCNILAKGLYSGNLDIVSKCILEHGMDINGKYLEGFTLLYWAASFGIKDIVEFLLESGAKVKGECADVAKAFPRIFLFDKLICSAYLLVESGTPVSGEIVKKISCSGTNDLSQFVCDLIDDLCRDRLIVSSDITRLHFAFIFYQLIEEVIMLDNLDDFNPKNTAFGYLFKKICENKVKKHDLDVLQANAKKSIGIEFDFSLPLEDFIKKALTDISNNEMFLRRYRKRAQKALKNLDKLNARYLTLNRMKKCPLGRNVRIKVL